MKHTGKQWIAAATSAALTLSCVTSAFAAAPAVPVGDGRTPTVDEAYYATLDYYGNLTEGSVVKSYVLNGATSITDYGEYESVTNLTDSTAASAGAKQVAFDFAGAAAVPTHFYFQGETAQPFQNLPWTLSISYTLNGVPTKAEDLAGKTGVVEINVDAIPNKDVSDYVRHNYTLEAMAVFNQDDILSLEAPGAQVQLLGNLRAVLFLAFPGEEGHFSIRVGAEKFEFGGMTFLMVPATLSQLEEIAKLAQRKDDLEENYNKLSGSLDELLDALDTVSGSLYASANGLDALNRARGTVSSGKGGVYEAADKALADLDAATEQLTSLNESMDTLSGEVAVASRAVVETGEAVRELTKQTVSLRTELDKLKSDLNDISGNRADLLRVINDLDSMQDELSRLSKRLSDVSFNPVMNYSNLDSTVSGFSSGKALYDVYNGNSNGGTMSPNQFGTAVTAILSSMGAVPSGTTWASISALGSGVAGLVTGGKTPAEAVSAVAVAQSLPEDMVNTAFSLWSGITNTPLSAAISAITDFEGFLNTLQAMLNAFPDYASKASDIAKLAALYADDPDAMEFLMDSSEDLQASTREIESNINRSIGAANGALSTLTGPTANLAEQLKTLCGHIGDLDDLINSADNIVTVTAQDTEKIKNILDEVEDLQAVLDKYEPETLRALDELSAVSDELSASGTQLTTTMTDTSEFLRSAEALMQEAGTQLDAATQQSLSALAASLRNTANALGKNSGVRSAKDTITDMIEDTWDDYTGDVNDLLEMDATATIESLTDPRNPAPASVQVLIRTQEIKVSEDTGATAVRAVAETPAAPATFWGRVAAMFTGMWGALVSIFHRG